MMPGIAIQPGFPIPAAPAARAVSAPADDGFSKALREKPNTPAQADGKADHVAKSGVDDDSGDGGATAVHGKDGKVGRAPYAKDKHDDGDDERAKKDDDEASGALPPQISAQRVLAGQWPTATPAAQEGTATADGQAAPASAGAPAPQGVGTAQANGTAVIAAQAASGIAVAAVAQAPGAVAAALQAPATPTSAQAGKEAGAVQPAMATPADPEPMPAGVTTASTAATIEAADPSAAFMAKVAALDHGGKPANAPQNPAPASGPAANTDAAQAKVAQTLAGQGSGNAGADPDSRGDGNGGAQGKATQSVAQPSAAAGSDPSASPPPTAQMVPTSGSAASFAAALAEGGRLARYVTSAASAAAAGAPAGTLPVQSLSIQLRPVELGMVTANLKYAGNQLSIDIEVQTPDAQRRLSSDSSDIVKSLQSLGFQVDKVTVRQVQPQAQAQTQSQPQGQPTARDGSAGGFGAQGGNPFSAQGGSERQAGQHRQGSESGYEGTSERGIGMVQPASDRQSRRGVFI